MISVVIMAGGRGERFWPQSRRNLPKQLLPLTGKKTMIQETVDRLSGLVKVEDIFVSTGIEYAELIKEQLQELPQENIIVEPCGRNTAPCIGLAAMYINKMRPGSTMVVLPADHLIRNAENFKSTLLWAIRVANDDGKLVTIGITPTKAETGYGYIQFENNQQLEVCNNAYKVKRFVEKPDLVTAQHYLDTGQYLWNSGMFIWTTESLLNNIQIYLPELYRKLDEIFQSFNTVEYLSKLSEIYPTCTSISIDYGLMEKAEDIYVLPGIFGWDDVGSWNALERVFEKDDNGNVTFGNVVMFDTKECIIQGKNRMVATVGLEDLVIVDTDDVTLICKKSESQNIKALLNKIKGSNNEGYL